MVIKVYISSISGNMEVIFIYIYWISTTKNTTTIIIYIKKVKGNQQRALFVLSGHHIEHQIIDISDPINETEKEFMIANSESNAKGLILPPQIFNENEYCGVYNTN